MGCSPSSPSGGKVEGGGGVNTNVAEKQEKEKQQQLNKSNHKLDFIQGNASHRLMTIMDESYNTNSSYNWRNMAFRRPQELNVLAAFPREDSLLNAIQSGSEKLKWKFNTIKITSSTNLNEWLNLTNPSSATSSGPTTNPPSSPSSCSPPTIDLLLLDYRQPKSVPSNTLDIVKSLKAQNYVLVVVAFVKKNIFEKNESAVNLLFDAGIDKVEIDHGIASIHFWTNELSQLEKSLVDTAYKLMMVQTLVTTLDHCHDMVQITDSRHRIQFVNHAYEKLLGCTKVDVIGTDFLEHQTKLDQMSIPPLSASPQNEPPIPNHLSSGVTTAGITSTTSSTTTAIPTSPGSHLPNSSAPAGTYFNYSLKQQQQMTRSSVQGELSNGKHWEGHYVYNRDTSAPLVLNTRVIPVNCYYGQCKTNPGTGSYHNSSNIDLLQFNNWNCTSYIYISEPPVTYQREKSLSNDYNIASLGSATTASAHEPASSYNPVARGSLKSLRKASYDIKSISNDGSVLRRQSLAKLHSLTIEAPITKVINIIAAAQQNSPLYIAQALERVLEILKTTELYSPQFFEGTNNIKVKSDDPLATDLLGALLSQGPKPGNISVRRSSNETASRLAPRPSLPDIAEAPSQLQRVLETESRWDFDVILLEEITEKRPLVWTGMAIFSRFCVAQTLKTDDTSIRNWLTLIEANYHSVNTYHNSTHAADVLQATAYFLSTERLKTFLEPIDEVISLIAAAVHDVDHPGKNSTYLTNTGNELALLYNDISVLESHHSAFTFKLTLSDSRVNIFKNLDTDTFKLVRSGLIDMVLATEMTKHFEHFSKFVNVFTKPLLNGNFKDGNSGNDQDYSTSPVPGGTSRSNSGGYLGTDKSMDVSPSVTPTSAEPDITTLITQDNIILIKRMLIKCADISNPARPKKSCIEWAKRIAEEYFRQTDEEISKGLPPVMPMFERDTCSIPKSQTGFIDYFVQDMFEAWDAFLDVPEIIEHLRINYDYWKDLDRQGIQSAGQVDSFNKLSGGN